MCSIDYINFKKSELTLAAVFIINKEKFQYMTTLKEKDIKHAL